MAWQPETQIGRYIRRSGAILALGGGLLTAVGVLSETIAQVQPAVCAEHPRLSSCEATSAATTRSEIELFSETVGALALGAGLLLGGKRIEQHIVIKQAVNNFDQQAFLFFHGPEGQPGEPPYET